MNIESVILLGSGNVATQFGLRLKEIGLDVKQVFGRNRSVVAELAAQLGAEPCADLDRLDTEADLYVIAVSDDAIAGVANEMPVVEGMVVHTSGNTPLSILPSERRGVLWPVHSIRKGMAIDWEMVNMVVESDLSGLHALAERMGCNVFSLDSRQRRMAHLTAVIANNFTNHLLHMVDTLSKEAEIDRTLFDPLIAQTVFLAMGNESILTQTGPAKRGDKKTIDAQLALLEKHPDFRAIYQTITDSILSTHLPNKK